MTVDARRIARTQAWLVKARRDLVTVEQILDHDAPMLDSVVYHCQQAGEKALKGFLFWHDIPFRKTHNLAELLDQCVTIDTTLSNSGRNRQFPHTTRRRISLPQRYSGTAA